MATESPMTAVASTPDRSASTVLQQVRRLFREAPVLPLLGLLLVLVLANHIVRPGIVTLDWIGVVIRATIPLAIIAGCQPLTMLTAGPDLSVGAVAPLAGFVVASLVVQHGLGCALAVAVIAAILAGLLSGIGVGVFRVHPLIMTLGVSLVVLGLANAWQIITVQSSTGVPDALRDLGSRRAFEVLPYSLVVFLPIAALILVGL